MTRDELAAQIALCEAALASLEAIRVLAETLPTSDAVALDRSLDSRPGIELRTLIRRGTQSSFELSIVGALGRRRVLARCDAARHPSALKESE